MQEQNFEKQVQDTLSELSLTPSAPVWQKVEQEIRQKKKRRRAIVFWLFAILLIGGGTFWGLEATNYLTHERSTSSVLQTNKPSQQPHTQSVPETETTAAFNEENTVISSQEASTNKSHTAAINSKEQTFKEPITDKAVVKENQDLAIDLPGIRARKRQNRTYNASKAAVPKEKQNGMAGTPSIITEESTLAITTHSDDLNEKSANPSPVTLQPSDMTATETSAEPSLTQPTQALPTPDSIQSKKSQKKAAKWSWAIQAGYGISSLQQDLVSRARSVPEVYSSPVLNSGSPAAPSQNRASSMETGAAFQAAFSTKRHLNNRFALTAAIQYSYFSIRSNVGQTVARDTVIRNTGRNPVTLNTFYRAGQLGPLKEYTNKFHFIELPMGIEWQLHKRLPVHLQTGASLSYLVATNALVFDPVAGIYYKSDDQFNKMHLHVFSGLTYRVWKHKKFGIHVGPYLQFEFTDLQKEGDSRHLLSTGLKTQVSF